MKLQFETVRKVVDVWTLIFPGNRSDAELEIIYSVFFKTLIPIYNEAEFKIAANMIVLETEFFPTVAGMVKLKNSVYQKAQALPAGNNNLKALPEETGNLTPEEIKQNLKRIEIIRKQLAGELTMEQAEAEQNKLTTYSR